MYMQTIMVDYYSLIPRFSLTPSLAAYLLKAGRVPGNKAYELTYQYTGVGLVVVGRVHAVESLLTSCVPKVYMGVAKVINYGDEYYENSTH